MPFDKPSAPIYDGTRSMSLGASRGNAAKRIGKPVRVRRGPATVNRKAGSVEPSRDATAIFAGRRADEDL
ncbi:hypothetical protein TC41_2051 [Alicyclobacillus acidocaldarius subsp. acidocaldarius Tc-4-1]|uniref:Uncharacterized protein n=1 Tax=Alicyclobacillus acidocaldarius (strain Tc-4-1) TaxID=1048834 RepID=F8IER6_ALIAT|nr:hypothetical protein TC41_2051 [Alicyclobacillus acidocaldarius subsp. acidocaldarius Tc-4-1]